VNSYEIVQYCNGVTVLGRWRTRCPPNMHLQNEFTVDVMNHAWEWKFVYCSVDTIYTLLLETKGIPLLY